jgi:predicted lipase
MRISNLAIVIASTISIASAAYDADLSNRAFYHAAAAYCADDSVQNWSCGDACNFLPLESITLAAKDSTFSFVGYSRAANEVIVAFRGSADIPNWITNFEFVPIPYEDVTDAFVHEGFYLAYKSVQDTLRSSVKALLEEHTDASVVVTGHSLGGALAVLASTDFIRNNLTGTGLTLNDFGTPRVGTTVFADYVYTLSAGMNHYRVVHASDIVPHIPPSELGFTQVG